MGMPLLISTMARWCEEARAADAGAIRDEPGAFALLLRAIRRAVERSRPPA
jgi:hypothetical protein